MPVSSTINDDKNEDIAVAHQQVEDVLTAVIHEASIRGDTTPGQKPTFGC